MEKWIKNECYELNKNSINSLFDNKIPIIIVKNFLSKEICENIKNEIERIWVEYYVKTTPKIGKIGITQYEFSNNKQDFFNKVNIYNNKMTKIHKIRNFLIKTISFNNSCKSTIAFEKEMKSYYFAGLIRLINNSALLHIDYAPRDAKGWDISKINSQIAWNIFISDDPSTKGIVYNKLWEDYDEKFKNVNNYGYDYSVVNDKDKIEYNSNQGDLVLFNSRNYHEVSKAKNKTITLSSFIGRLSNENFIFWS